MTLRATVFSALAWLAVVATGCADGARPVEASGPTSPPDTLPGLIVSQPVSGPAAASRSVGGLSASAPAGGSVVYVSLVPGTVPEGLQATVRDQENGQVVTTPVMGGGFDPVAIAASVGDTLAVEITRSGAAGALRAMELVRAAHPPAVVRTSPPRGGRDVPLNAIMVLVFSEPLDSTVLDSGSVGLWQGTTPVVATARFADTEHLRVELHPDSLLAPQTNYQVVVTTAIRDMSGLQLDSAATVPFTTGTTAPVGNLVFASVSPGFNHTCGVVTAGAAYCWGANYEGELGDGNTGNNSSTPVLVAGGLTFASVSAAFQYTCGATTSRAASCWGVVGDSVPDSVAGGLTFVSVSAGFAHACAVTTSGAAYCWGDNEWGQLGNGATSYSQTPVPVAGGLTFRAVSAGARHSCGVTTAGTAYCWGENTLGELGIGTPTGPEECLNGDTLACSTTPVPVAGGLSFATVSAGGEGTCGVTTSGAAYCWGENGGLLGTDPSAGPEQCEIPADWPAGGPIPCSRVPVEVPGGLTLSSVSAYKTDGGACGLTPTGVAYCWGGIANSWSPGSPNKFSPVAVPGGLTFATVSTGYFHACGVTSAGVAYCWGNNESGELGDGTTTDSSMPVKVAGQP